MGKDRRLNEPVTDYWLKNYMVEVGHFLCPLCGNSGKIDTRGRAISAAGVDAGKLNYCICPNGQIMRNEKVILED